MNIEEIKERVDLVQKISDYDNEVAHIKEDEIYHEFVESIVNNKFKSLEEVINASKEIYKLTDIIYNRWYA